MSRGESRLKRLGQLVAGLQDARARRREALAQARAVFIDGAVFGEEKAVAVGRGLRVALAGAFAFAIFATVFFVWHAKSLRPPSFMASSAVSGQAVPVTVGRWLSAPAMEDVILSFSDGARFTLRAGGHARLTSLSVSGGRLTIERGEIQGMVPPHGNSWVIQAGPIDVTLEGSSSSVEWDPSADKASLDVVDGHAVVSGNCVGDAPRSYERGARPSFDCLASSL